MAEITKRLPDCGNEPERGERGERGKRGHRGHRGHDGRDGATGPTGPCCTGPTGPGSPVTSQWTALVDPALGDDATGVVGDLSKPFATIQGALNAIPAPVDGATARRAFTVLVSPGTYDEDLTVDLTGGKHVTLASWGPWNLGLFNAPDWQPSGPARSINIITTNNVTFDFINPAFAIEPMLPANIGDETEIAQVQVPRISGQIVLAGIAPGTLAVDVSVMAQIYGIANAAIVAGAAEVFLRVHRSRVRGTVTGSALILQDANESRFDRLLDIEAYGRLSQCFFGDGMTIIGTSPSSGTTPGFYLCNVNGVFTGPTGIDAYWFDEVTSYWFVVNGATFGGGVTRRLVEESNPMALPEQWVRNAVPAGAPVTPLSTLVSTNFNDISMIRSGSIVGMRARLTGTITAGSIAVEVTRNGAGTGFFVSLNPGSTGDFKTADLGAFTYAPNDLIGVQFLTDVALAPTTLNLEVWLEVSEELP